MPNDCTATARSITAQLMFGPKQGAEFFWKCHESDGDWLNNRCDGETSELIKIVPYFSEFLVHSYYIAQSTRYLDICNAIIRDRTTS